MVVINKGQHHAAEYNSQMLNITQRKVSGVFTYTCVLDESCVYDMNCIEQNAYNKLMGLSRSQITNDYYSAMIGWRWNIEKEKFDFCVHYHPRSRNDFHQYYIKSVDVSEEFEISIWEGPETWNIQVDRERYDISKVDTEEIFDNTFWITPSWFGGVKPAPKDVCIKYKILDK